MTKPEWKPKTPDDYFRDWESHVFGYGYGTGEPHTVPALVTFFGLLDDAGAYKYNAVEAALTPTVAWLMINILCRADIIEYGSSPRYGWTTKNGKELLAYLLGKTADEVLDIIDFDEHYVHCYPNACNCGPSGGYEEGRVCQNPFWLGEGRRI